MYNELGLSKKIVDLASECEKEIEKEFKNIDDVCEYNSLKVLNAFHKNKVSESHFNMTTGYGYNDEGRNVIENVYADVFKSEDALVRSQFISGTHALTSVLFGILRPLDTLLSINGKPYDTLDEVIGITPNNSSLKSFNINYEQIELVDNDFDYKLIEKRLRKSFIKLVEIQRSKGYSTRKSINLDKVEKVISLIKKVSPKTVVMVDNCYCEFVGKVEPIEVGADIVVGSLIKNLGAGIVPNGAYVVGKKDLIGLVASRLNVPGEGKEVGPSLGMNKLFLQGLFLAPNVVASSLKTAVLASRMLEQLNYTVDPKYNDERVDIVQSVMLKNEKKLINFCRGIQNCSPIDSYVTLEPWDMPGYSDKVIMAAGTFTQGSSIELSCDAPIREPYIAYLQGGLTYQYGKLAVIKAISNICR